MNNKVKSFYLLLIGESDHWIITAFTAALVGKITMTALGLLIFIITHGYGASTFSGRITHNFGRDLFVFVIFDPPFESFIVLILVIITKCLKRKFSALFVGFVNILLHNLSPISFSVFPVFFLHGMIQRNWKDKGRTLIGYITITFAHFLHNFITLAAFYTM